MEISSESVLGGHFTTAKRCHESDVFSVTLNHQESAAAMAEWELSSHSAIAAAGNQKRM
jgi:hypothetical protein